MDRAMVFVSAIGHEFSPGWSIKVGASETFRRHRPSIKQVMTTSSTALSA